MKPWEHLATAETPGGNRLELLRHDQDYLIRVDGLELMSSRSHSSERALMALACPDPRPEAHVLVGGLGMGYTLAATLSSLSPQATVVVAELSPAVVEWNRGALGPLAGHPLQDPRTQLVVGDVRETLNRARERFDAILLDVDNGPSALTEAGNSWLYSHAGLAAIRRALRPGGALAVWALGADVGFERRLQASGFASSTHCAAAHGQRGPKHVVFVGRKR